ncbi:MAG: hypothetical protein HKL98_02410 [Burkholderiales bacterium]|nr:hypothetical protein [Burkholderiales bacterium]
MDRELIAGRFACPDIEAFVISTLDGQVVATTLSGEPDHAAHLAAALISMGERLARDFSVGALEQVAVVGRDGYVHLIHAGKNAVLASIVKDEEPLKRLQEHAANIAGR